MKISSIKLTAINLALVSTLAVLAGCASNSGYEKGAAASAALNSTAASVADVSTNVNGVLSALNNLTFKSSGDLRGQYNALISASKTLRLSVDELDAKMVAITNATAAYMSDWTNKMEQIQNEELRKRSSERKAEVSSKLGEVEDSYVEVKKSLVPFESDLKDIQTYLDVDLTPTGVNTIKDVVSKTKVDAVPLRDSIKKLQGSFTSLSAALSPVMPGAEPK